MAQTAQQQEVVIYDVSGREIVRGNIDLESWATYSRRRRRGKLYVIPSRDLENLEKNEAGRPSQRTLSRYATKYIQHGKVIDPRPRV